MGSTPDRQLSISTGIIVIASLALAGADWPRFRGGSGSGVSDDAGFPSRWSDTEGVLWKAELPGPGSSSPVAVGGRVFLTCYSGYGTSSENPGRIEDLKRHVVCVDRKSGSLLWDRSFSSKQAEAPYRGIGIPNHGYASSTPAADADGVYAFFGVAGVVAFDHAGKELWRADIAPSPGTHDFGSASSPVVHEGLVVVPASVECEAIVAFDKTSGKEVWRSPADGYGAWWGTPVVARVGDRSELVISVPGEIWGINPANGKLRWHASSFPERNLIPSVVVAKDVAYAIGGRSGGSAAVRLGGRGDVSRSHVVWTGSAGTYIASPVYHDGHLYWITDRGIAVCVDAASGKETAQKRLGDTGTIYSSLLAAGGKLYAVTRRNGTLVLEATPSLTEVGRNVIASDGSDFNASPAVSDGVLYLRSNRFLYAIGKS